MMPDKQGVAAIILGVAAVFSLAYGIVSSTDNRHPESGAAAAQGSPGYDDIPRVVNRRARRTKFSSWRRSPFVPPGISGGGSSGHGLEGIMWSENGPLAIFDGAVVHQGDAVTGGRVADIRRDSIIVNNGTADTEITLEDK